MSLSFVDQPGRVPYVPLDSTRSWIEQVGRKNGLVKPQVLLRFATDTNWIRDGERELYTDYPRKDARTKAVMNLTLPGMRLPGMLSWSVTESLDQVVQQASLEALNALPVSRTKTKLIPGTGVGATLTKQYHSSDVIANFVQGSLFAVEKVPGNLNVEYQTDSDGYLFKEKHVRYRTFGYETFTVVDASGFPNPAIPNDDDNDIPDDNYFMSANDGVGSYFVLIDQEVIRVADKVGNTFFIPPGGRAVNGILQAHGGQAEVKLLGYGPYTGDWCAMGYLNVDDFSPQSAILRPGTALVSYEGYGDIKSRALSDGRNGLTHDTKRGDNYQFTGYWFVTAVEPSIDESGVPKVKVDLAGPGYMYDAQKITPDLVRRIKNKFGTWKVDGQGIFAAAGHKRNIEGDWVDYNHWDPSLPQSYPLTIRTEFAQHKAFADHMSETNWGKDCYQCREEYAEWTKTHKDGGGQEFVAQRAVGRHIYKESIRVLRAEAGPIKTYIRLMSTLAAAAWDHPAMGNELGQRFTKIPNKLFDNIRDIKTGLVYNGQIVLEKKKGSKDFDWFTPGYDDTAIISERAALTAPFESTYDNAAFSQPMLDLAEINGNTFWVDRHGRPCFKPRNWSMRPFDENNEWFATHGGSISAYSHNINSSAVVTQAWVTAKTAFDSELTVLTGGTGYSKKGRTFYSGLGGNREGLALTSGVQNVQTQSLENQVLGLDWNTDPAWGIRFVDGSGQPIVAVRPAAPDGSPELYKGGPRRPAAIKRLQRTIKFFQVRKLMGGFQSGGEWVLMVKVDGKFGEETHDAVVKLQQFLNNNGASITADGRYRRETYKAIENYLDTNEHFIKHDIFWYVASDPSTAWQMYVAAVTGVPIHMNKKKGGDVDGDDVADYVPDRKSNNEERETWTKGFAKSVINVGNRIIDESLDKATARTISSNMADPRIIPGDVVWCDIPGFLSPVSTIGDMKPPFKHGIYVTSISRQMDMQTGSYTATYSGYRFRGEFNQGSSRTDPMNGYDFVT